ncbi:MAG: tetratricopeptide repeat protein [Gemmataceae bacterium]
MRLGDRRYRLLLILLLVVLMGASAYLLGWHVWGSHHLRAARAALERRDFRHADTHLRAYLAVWPKEPTAQLLAARSARRQGNVGQCLQHLRWCQNSADLREAVDLEYRLNRLKASDLLEAEALLAQCFSHPQDANTPLILEAVIQSSLKLLSAATTLGLLAKDELVEPYVARTRRAVDLWLELRPGPFDRAEGLVWRGQLEKFTKGEKALADFRKALDLNPNHFDAAMHLAMYVMEADPEQAIASLERLNQRYPKNALVRYDLASAYRAMGRLEKARQLFDDMLADNPNEVSALIERGYLSLDRQEVEDAERRFRRALELAPANARGYLALSCCLQLRGNAREAKPYREKFQQLEAEEKRFREEAARQLERTLKRDAAKRVPAGSAEVGP